MKTQFENLSEGFAEYMRARDYSQVTIADYKKRLRYFFRYVESRGIDSIQDVTREHVFSYQNYLACEYRKKDGTRLSIGGQTSHLSPVKSFFRYLARARLILVNPAADLEVAVPRQTLPRTVLSIREVKRLLKQPDTSTPCGLRDRAILETLYSTGIRSGEVLNLTIHDVDFEQGEITVRGGKGKKDRVVPVGEEALRYLERYLKTVRPKHLRDQSEKHLFLSRRGNPAGHSCLLRRFHRYGRAARIKSRVGFHTLRHTCATHMLRGGADIRVIQALLGHVQITTTQRYTRVEIGDLKRALKKAHPRERYT